MLNFELILNSIQDALVDLVHILPFLYLTFLFIEIIEYFYFKKVADFALKIKKLGPFLGAILACVPQCGFSVIASVLYIRGLISKGTLLSIYLSTSDEAIPVLLAMPDKLKIVLPVILIKITIGIVAGYLIDFIFPSKELEDKQIEFEQKGCCEHSLEGKDKNELIIHPFIHTFYVSLFLLVITSILNVFISHLGSAQKLGEYLMLNSPLQPVGASLFGLIPNCAVSVALIILYTKGTIAFYSLISGLCANAGLGLWVVVSKNKNRKDSLFIVSSLFLISVLAGFILYLIQKII